MKHMYNYSKHVRPASVFHCDPLYGFCRLFILPQVPPLCKVLFYLCKCNKYSRKVSSRTKKDIHAVNFKVFVEFDSIFYRINSVLSHDYHENTTQKRLFLQ